MLLSYQFEQYVARSGTEILDECMGNDALSIEWKLDTASAERQSKAKQSKVMVLKLKSVSISYGRELDKEKDNDKFSHVL